MAKYIIQGETLTNIAEEIRTISGATETMLPNEMISNLGGANAEIDSQATKISQIISALDEKLSNGTSIKTATVKPTSRVRNISFTG